MAADGAPSLVVIGMEGVWRTAIMLSILSIAAALPGRDLGTIENTMDSIVMVSQNRVAQVHFRAARFCETMTIESMVFSIVPRSRPGSAAAIERMESMLAVLQTPSMPITTSEGAPSRPAKNRRKKFRTKVKSIG